MGRYIPHGSTDQSVFLRILATDGTAKTDVTAATGNVAMTYAREGGNATSAGTVGNLASGDAAHSDAGLIHLTAGLYRADPPDAAFASGSDEVAITVTGDDLVCVPAVHPLGPVPANVTHVGGSGEDLPTATDMATIDGNVDTLIERVPGNITITGGRVVADTTAISGNGTAADNLESFALGGALATLPKVDIQQVNGGASAADDLRTAIEAGIALETTAQSILTDTAEIGAAGAGLTALPWNASWDAEVQSEVTDALNAYDPPTNAEMEARTLAAAAYFDPTTDRVLLDKADALRVTGSVNDGSASTTSFVTTLTEATNDHYKGRVVIFTSGAMSGQASDITAYNGTTKALTVTALTEAPANSVTFEIV